MTPLERHAAAEREWSLHQRDLKASGWDCTGDCSLARARNGAYRAYTKRLHVSER